MGGHVVIVGVGGEMLAARHGPRQVQQEHPAARLVRPGNDMGSAMSI